MWSRVITCTTAMLMCVVGNSSARAQTNPKSQLGTVTQQLVDTRIELRYRRPVARGRALFGALVPWG
ncbi:MAG TPA: DUF2911 domain-containing protein, partial [Gemmatimonadaceae bacterium]